MSNHSRHQQVDSRLRVLSLTITLNLFQDLNVGDPDLPQDDDRG